MSKNRTNSDGAVSVRQKLAPKMVNFDFFNNFFELFGTFSDRVFDFFEQNGLFWTFEKSDGNRYLGMFDDLTKTFEAKITEKTMSKSSEKVLKKCKNKNRQFFDKIQHFSKWSKTTQRSRYANWLFSKIEKKRSKNSVQKNRFFKKISEGRQGSRGAVVVLNKNRFKAQSVCAFSISIFRTLFSKMIDRIIFRKSWKMQKKEFLNWIVKRN